MFKFDFKEFVSVLLKHFFFVINEGKNKLVC